MADTPKKKPLWRAMFDAWFAPGAPTVGHRWAAVVEAMADWLVPEEPLPEGGSHHVTWAVWGERQNLRKRLLWEAHRARRGDG